MELVRGVAPRVAGLGSEPGIAYARASCFPELPLHTPDERRLGRRSEECPVGRSTHSGGATLSGGQAGPAVGGHSRFVS